MLGHACTALHGNAGRLVEDDDILILVDDHIAQPTLILGAQTHANDPVVLLLWDDDFLWRTHFGTRAQAVARLFGAHAINPDLALADHLFDPPLG